MTLLAAKDVQFTYQSKYQKVHALKGVSCTFEEGKFYAIVGRSGSGKTTLLSMLAGLGVPTDGEICVGDKTLKDIGSEKHRRENVSVIYQSFNLLPALSILENVMYPMRLTGKSKGEAKEKAKELLAAVGLADVDPRKLPAMLSGGQQQRVAIARARASEAKIILADEPTGNLDSENGRLIVDLLRRLVDQQGYCVIVVTHDMDIASQADQVYRMKDGVLDQDW